MNHHFGSRWRKGCTIEIERPVELGICGYTGVEVGGVEEVEGK